MRWNPAFDRHTMYHLYINNLIGVRVMQCCTIFGLFWECLHSAAWFLEMVTDAEHQIFENTYKVTRHWPSWFSICGFWHNTRKQNWIWLGSTLTQSIIYTIYEIFCIFIAHTCNSGDKIKMTILCVCARACALNLCASKNEFIITIIIFVIILWKWLKKVRKSLPIINK